MDFLDILIDFSGHFSGAPKWYFSDLKMHFWGFGVPGLCSKPGRLHTASQKSTAIHLQFVLQYAPNLYCSTFGAPTL